MPRSSLISILTACFIGCASAPPATQPEPPAAPVPPPPAPVPEEPSAAPPPESAPEPTDAPPAPGGMTWQTREPGASVPDAWRVCSSADDCKLVEVACCDHCNGGKVVSVHTRHGPDAEKLRPQCGPTMCTKRACLTRAACESGSCVVQAPSGAP